VHAKRVTSLRGHEVFLVNIEYVVREPVDEVVADAAIRGPRNARDGVIGVRVAVLDSVCLVEARVLSDVLLRDSVIANTSQPVQVVEELALRGVEAGGMHPVLSAVVEDGGFRRERVHHNQLLLLDGVLLDGLLCDELLRDGLLQVWLLQVWLLRDWLTEHADIRNIRAIFIVLDVLRVVRVLRPPAFGRGSRDLPTGDSRYARRASRFPVRTANRVSHPELGNVVAALRAVAFDHLFEARVHKPLVDVRVAGFQDFQHVLVADPIARVASDLKVGEELLGQHLLEHRVVQIPVRLALDADKHDPAVVDVGAAVNLFSPLEVVFAVVLQELENVRLVDVLRRDGRTVVAQKRLREHVAALLAFLQLEQKPIYAVPVGHVLLVAGDGEMAIEVFHQLVHSLRFPLLLCFTRRPFKNEFVGKSENQKSENYVFRTFPFAVKIRKIRYFFPKPAKKHEKSATGPSIARPK